MIMRAAQASVARVHQKGDAKFSYRVIAKRSFEGSRINAAKVSLPDGRRVRSNHL
jgi:hypothetical protein